MDLFQRERLEEKGGELDRWTEGMADPAEGQSPDQPERA